MYEQPPVTHIAPEDPSRQLTAVAPDDPQLQHLGVVSDTYTVLVTAEESGGRYAMLDMLIPPDGGPPPHRHDFEEMFHVLDGEVVVTFRDDEVIAKAGTTVNIPALAPHAFTNRTDRAARLLCIVSPPGLEQYFAAFGERLASRTAPAPKLGDDELQSKLAAAAPLAQRFGIENLPPGS